MGNFLCGFRLANQTKNLSFTPRKQALELVSLQANLFRWTQLNTRVYIQGVPVAACIFRIFDPTPPANRMVVSIGLTMYLSEKVAWQLIRPYAEATGVAGIAPTTAVPAPSYAGLRAEGWSRSKCSWAMPQFKLPSEADFEEFPTRGGRMPEVAAIRQLLWREFVISHRPFAALP